MEAVGLGASVAAATNIFSYDRDAWMTDVQVKQNRRIQKQQMLLSQYDMFREDIRDTVGSNISRQNNYIVIATLLLGMMGECFIEGWMSEGASKFLQAIYVMCITSSLVYLVLSVLCAIGANNLAVGWQRSLLTRQVRLPIQEMLRELDEDAPNESVEAFERQSFATMLRVPGLSRLRGAAATSERTPSSSSAPVAEAGSLPSDGAQSAHILLFKKHAISFEQLEELCMLFGAMGLHHLLQGYAFFAAASYYEGRGFASITVPLTIAFIDAILTWAFFNKGCGGWGKTGMAFSVGAILLAVVGIRVQGKWDDTCICLSFACEVMTNILGHFKLKSATQFQSEDDHSCDCEDDTIPRGPTPAANAQTVDRSAMVASMGTLIVIAAWMSMLGWVLSQCFTNDIIHGHESNVVLPLQQEGRSLRGLAVGGSSWDFEPLAVTWPDDHFAPSALACAGASSAGSGAHCVLGNEFVVFQFRDLDSAGASGSHTLEHVPCNVSGSILDVALECGDDLAEGKPCRTLVLVRGPARTAVVDCATGKAQPLIEAVPGSATHLAASPSAPGAWSGARGSLLTVQAGKVGMDSASTVVQRGRVEPDLGSWAPLWTLAKLPGRELAAVRAASGGSGGGTGRWLLVGSTDGLLELFDLRRRSLQQAAFAVPGPQPLLAAGRLVSAAPVAGGSALVLLGPSEGEAGVAGDMVRLGRVRWPHGFTLDW